MNNPPLYVELTHPAGCMWCAWQPDIVMVGYGDTAEEALADFAEALIQLAAIFDEENLGPGLIPQKEFLDAHWTWSTVQ